MSKLKKFEKESIVFFESKYNDIFTTSKDIADKVKMKHESVAALIKKFKRDFSALGEVVFSDFKSGKRGRPTKKYLLNEQQALLLMTYLRNNKIVRNFKIELVKQFYTMREIIREKQTKEWEFQRIANKTTRKLEADQIKIFIDYATSQGSKNANRYYTAFSNLANKCAQIHNRDFSDFKKLKNLEVIENVIKKELISQIAKREEYHNIYQTVKERAEMVAQYL